MKYTIMTKILFMLLARKKLTAREVAERFGISQRSVYRYIDELTLSYVPIISDRGSGGGFYLPESYKLPASFLTRQEFEKLSAILNAFSGEIASDEELSFIRDKLFSATKRGLNEGVFSNSLIVDGSSWNGFGGNREKISVINKAIADQTMLKISYHDRNGEKTKRLVEPHALVLKQGLWYVYAFCRLRDEFRLFKVSRIEYAKVDKAFSRREFDAQLIPFKDWEQEKNEDIELEVSPSVRSDVEEWLGIDCVSETKTGKIIANCSLPYGRSLVSEIMKYGNAVRIVSPEKLKKDVAAAAKEIVSLYG